ncbi:MAG TPA: AMP-binding protein [Clostridia bacterium]|nr:MAG: Acetyl-coenzyme A synthetase [Firmicutes bacterium ADurb.Bin146]HOD93630.1 AMP-binding protein [Clostridia bacterium]HQM40008.1 AMP-binding protein [Clostridia bacterium]
MLEKYLSRTQFDSYEDFVTNYKLNIPENFNFGFDIVDAWADEDCNLMALVWCDDHNNEKLFTFNDIKKMSNQAANYFISLGIKKGSKVLVILRRRWEYWIVATALHKIGAVLIPASLQLTKKDIAYRANAADVEAIICINDDFVITQAESALPDSPTVMNLILVDESQTYSKDNNSDGINVNMGNGWKNLSYEAFKYSDVFMRPTGMNATKTSDTMLIYFTSGTTGMPKMVHHDYSYPLGHIVTAKYWQCVEKGKLHMSVSDSGWAKFGWGKIYGQWICGATVFAYDMDKFIPAKLLSMMEKYKLTTFCAPPTMFRFMLLEDVAKYDLSSIKRYCIAGEPLNPEIFKKWKDITGKALTEGFGQSESSVMIANFKWIEPKPGSMGKPAPLYDIHLVNAEGNFCEDGEEGEITIQNMKSSHPAGLFLGYYKDTELTSQYIHNGVYNLKDVAWRDSDGYYWFVGRHDDVIKCSGYRIGPFEVESALLEHDAVVECAVTAVADELRGQKVKATVVLKKGYAPSDELIKQLQEHVKKVTAPYKYPRIIEFTDELPKTLGGKIKRGEIRSKDSSR